MDQANRIAYHADNASKAAIEASNNLTFALMALVGACMSKTKKDVIDLAHLDVFIDQSPSSTDEDAISSIEYDDVGEIIARVTGNDDYKTPLENLPLSTRIELVKVLNKILTH